MEQVFISWQATAFAVTAIIGALYKTLKHLVLFNDNVLRRRKAAYLSFLKGEASTDDALGRLIDALRAEETFRKVFSRYASPKLSAAIIALHQTGRFSIHQLRTASPYFRLDKHGHLECSPGRIGTLVKVTGGIAMVAMTFFTLGILYRLTANATPLSLGASALFFAVYLTYIWFIGKDVKAIVEAEHIDRIIKSLARESGIPRCSAQPAGADRTPALGSG